VGNLVGVGDAYPLLDGVRPRAARPKMTVRMPAEAMKAASAQ
jgi:hypothetical protein